MDRPTLRAPHRHFLAAALATLLFAGGLRAFLASIYYHNLTSLGLNATVLFSLLLLSPLLFLAPRLARDPRRLALLAGILLAAARLAMPPTRGTLLHLATAGLAAAAFLVLLPALLRASRSELGDDGPRHLALGIVLGWAADVTLQLVWGSFDRTATLPGLALVLPAGAALVALLARAPPAESFPRSRDPQPGWPRMLLAGLGVGAWLFLEHATLAAPHALSRWGPDPLVLTAAGALLGLLAGAYLVARPPRAWTPTLLALNAAGLLGLLDHAYLNSPLAPLLLGAAQAALALDLALMAHLLSRASLRRIGLVLAPAALALLLLHFILAFSYTFAFVPLGELWRNQEETLGWLAFLLVLAGAAAAGRDALRPPAPRTTPTRTLAGVAVALVALSTLALAWPASAIETPPTDRPLRVLSFNLHQGFNNDGALDPDLFVAVLREADADLVALQESDTPRFTSGNLDVVHHLARRLGYHVAYGPPTRDQSVGLSLLSRHPIAETTVVPLPSASDNRFFLEARLDVHGEDVWVYVVHLGLPQPDRMNQTSALLARAEARAPRILAGDFNSCPSGHCPTFEGPSDDVYARVTAAHADGWAALGGDAADPAALTYDAFAPHERIDYVFASAGLTFTRYETVRTADAQAGSDHLPVLAEMRLEPSTTPP